VLAWALYDWANSAFAATVVAAFFPAFYAALAADAGLSAADSHFWFNVALTVSSVLAAIAAPALGAIADAGGRRKQFLAAFAFVGVLMTAALAWVHAGMWHVALVFYSAGSIGFAGANTFYDSMLLDVSAPEDYDVVSADGFALGYLGGGLLLAANVAMVNFPQWFGLAGPGDAVAASFITVAAWWAAFTLPLLFMVGEAQPSPRPSARRAMREGLASLRATFHQARSMKTLLLFLVAYWFYIDGVGTIFKTAVFFGAVVLGLPTASLITAILLTQFISFPAALLFGWLGKRISARRGILICIGVYAAVIVYAWGWLATAADFYLLAAAVGLVQGGAQSLSRSLYARFVPKSKAAEFFGFFNMVGKFAAILGPLLLALTPVLIAAADERDSILALLLLFAVGGALLWRVDAEVGAREAG